MSKRQSPADIQDPLGLEIGPRSHTPCPHPTSTPHVHTLCSHSRSTLLVYTLGPHPNSTSCIYTQTPHPTSTLCPHPTSTHTPAWPGHGDPRDTQGADPAHRSLRSDYQAQPHRLGPFQQVRGQVHSGAQREWRLSSRPGEGREIIMPEPPPTQQPPAGSTCLEAPSCSGRPTHEPA